MLQNFLTNKKAKFMLVNITGYTVISHTQTDTHADTQTDTPIRVYGVNRGQPYRTMEQWPSIRMVLQL